MAIPDTVCLALPVLFDAVVQQFKDDCTNAEQFFGWREPQKHKTASARLTWVPGDPSGSIGVMVPARNPGENPRSLGTLPELFTVYVAANDPQQPENERAQYVATRLLYDAWFRAVYLAAYGTFEVLDLSWNTEKNERRYGAEMICLCTIQAKVPDSPYTLAPDDTKGVVVVSLEDVDETVTVTP